MTNQWVFLCPGQGAQYVGMGKALYESHPTARDLYDRGNEVLGFDLRAIAFEGPEEELTRTLNTQPAVFTLDVVCAALLREAGIEPVATAGHSLGEYAACVVAGAMTFEDGLKLTRLRGELMYRAGVERPGAMAAILGLSISEIEGVLGEIEGTVVPANLNTASQIVISGDEAAVEAALPRLKERGARRAVRLPVSGAFHSPLMEPAAEGLARALAGTPIEAARVPVVANESGAPVQEAGAIREALTRQLTSQVRWEPSMRYLLDSGHDRFVEVGPGKALQGMLRQIDRSAAASGVESPSTLEAFLAGLDAGGRQ